MNNINDPSFLAKLASIKPSPRQLIWQAMEFYGFIHYGVNQFTKREWGTGEEDPKIFNPQQLDTDQWCESLAKAQMKGVIITAKHHDGFCLWDTRTTKHSVMYSPYAKDIVAQLATSCKKFGLKLGIYLSPWDRNASTYGQGDTYNDFFSEQLTELLTGYGDLFCLWFDGANGEGPNGKVQHYNWNRYYDLIRKHQPNAVISVVGPDVRWCGNEAGHCRTNEWSVVPAIMADKEKIQEASQQEDGAEFRGRITSSIEDLGSREFLVAHENYIWYPAEVNTSIRPGWFYHAEEDDQVRAFEELKTIYLQSVGGNATFLLNIPPHPDGYLAEQDVKRLEELGNWIKKSFTNDLLAAATFETMRDIDGTIIILAETPEEISPKYLMIQEEITLGQRVEAFELLYLENNEWNLACIGTVVGYKAIRPLDETISAIKWQLRITAYRAEPILKTIAFY